MQNVYKTVAAVGVDVHYTFSKVSMRDGRGQLVRRERLDHPDREQLRRRLRSWPKGVPDGNSAQSSAPMSGATAALWARMSSQQSKL